MRAFREGVLPLFGDARPYDALYTLSSSRCAVVRQPDELALRLAVGETQAEALLVRLCPEQAAHLISQLQEHLALLKAA